MNASSTFTQEPLMADVLLARSGDRDAFARLVDGCANTVTSIVLAIVRDLQACEDIAQDVFLSAWSNLKKLRNPDSFLPWLRQTARNQANTWLRERIRERATTCQADEMLAQAADPRMDTAANMLASEERSLLYKVIESLPEEAREVVTLYYREGRSTAQVAMLLEMREEAVRQRLSRARAQLRDDLLERFGKVASRSAAPATFTAGIMTALTMAAPTAVAGTAAGSAAGAGKAGLGLLGKVFANTLPGAVGGLMGVYYGMRRELMDADSPEEKQALKKMGLLAGIAVLGAVASFGVTNMTHQVWPGLVGYSGFSIVMILLYVVRLPQITEKRRQRQVEQNPELAASFAKQRNRARAMVVLGFSVGWATMIWALWMVSQRGA